MGQARLIRTLGSPVDIAGLVYFRIAFGVVMMWEVWRMFDNRWIERYFSGKYFYFTYWPFTFVRPLPEEQLHCVLILMASAALFVVLGLFYRWSASLLFLMITYLFLIEKARYLNHIYLVCLLTFLMIFVPAHRAFSLDALARKRPRSSTVPAWSLWLLRFQVGVPYFFGGLAKINHDWLRGEPLRAWLADRTDFPGLGQYFTNEAVVWFTVYGSLLLDLSVVFLLLWRRTRVFVFGAALLFHFANSRLFGIGIFPWAMIAATVLFFEPDWPRRVWRDLRQGHPFRSPALAAGFVLGFFLGGFLPHSFSLVRALIGALGVAVFAYHLDEPWRRPQPGAAATPEVRAAALRTSPAGREIRPLGLGAVVLLGLWVALQVLIPLRHFLIPGNVHWTEEGHRFAWHMKLRDKEATTRFFVTDPASGRTWTVDPRTILTRRQTSKMSSRPDMMVQFARYLEEHLARRGYQDVVVRVSANASLNGRRRQLFIDPEADLSEARYPWFGHADWILPLEEPLFPDQSEDR